MWACNHKGIFKFPSQCLIVERLYVRVGCMYSMASGNALTLQPQDQSPSFLCQFDVVMIVFRIINRHLVTIIPFMGNDDCAWGMYVEHGKWRVGSLEALQPQEESPFIGQLDPGKHQLAIETGMYRAPGFAYSTPATDFLLIRNATGAISLRELTGCIAVGQEVPAMRAPIPGSRDVRYGAGVDVGVHVGVGAHSGVIQGLAAGVVVEVIAGGDARGLV